MFYAGRILALPQFIFVSDPQEARLVCQHYLQEYERCARRPFQRVTADYDMVIGYDSETTGLDVKVDQVSLVTTFLPSRPSIPELGLDGRKFASFVFTGPAVGDFDCIRELAPVLEHPRICKVGANIAGFDEPIARASGFALRGPLHDTLVMSFAYNENRRAHGLKAAMWDFYGLKMVDFKDTGKGNHDVRTWPFHAMLNYTGLDGFASYKHWEFLVEGLLKFRTPTGTAWDVYATLLQPMQYVLRSMMDKGIRVDMGYLDTLGPEIQKQITEIYAWFQKRWNEKQIHDPKTIFVSSDQRKRMEREVKKGGSPVPTPEPINLNSTDHLRHLFFTLLKERVLEKTKPGKVSGKQNPSLAKSVLEELSEGEFVSTEYAQKLLQFRELDKLYGTYIGDKLDGDEEDAFGRAPKKGGLRNKVHSVTERVHTNFKFGPVTGRLSSSGPNLMNIPTKTDLGKKIRQAFVPDEGYSFVVADYEQLEMRLFAHFSEDGVPEDRQIMCAAIREGLDPHCKTASLMLSVPYEDVLIAKLRSDGAEEKLTKLGVTDFVYTPKDESLVKMRTAGKTIGFGILYGMGPYRLSIQLDISNDLAQEYIDLFFRGYPFAKNWIDRVHKDCEQTGLVWTLLNRPRRLQEIFSKEKWVRARAKRQSVNSIIQGSAADIVLSAMLRVAESEDLNRMGCRMLLQVHDELVFEVPSQHAKEAETLIKGLMTYKREEYGLGVDITVSSHIVSTWGDAK